MIDEIEKGVPPVEEQPPQTTVERWVADSGCSQVMTPLVDYMWSTTEKMERVIRIADDPAKRIEGIGYLPMSSWSGKD